MPVWKNFPWNVGPFGKAVILLVHSEFMGLEFFADAPLRAWHRFGLRA